jgi:hypothetical protein
VPADSLRRALDSVFTDPAYAWPQAPALSEVPGWFRVLLHVFRTIVEWFSRPLGRLEAAGFPLRLFLAVVALGILIHAAIRLGRQAAEGARNGGAAFAAGAPARDERWFWRRADQLVALGAYGPAMLAAFHAAMLALDGRGLLAYRASATPRELLARARLDPERRGRFTALLAGLYRTAFAEEPISDDDYRGWIRALREVTSAPAA